MTISYLLRHGRTALSAAYQANGDPSSATPLDAMGVQQCSRVAATSWPAMIATCVTSEFLRCQQTAQLIVGPHVRLLIEPDLNEINYGAFEGGPWMAYGDWLRHHGPNATPPGGESRRTAVRRILRGLDRCLTLPGPRLIAGHGLMISIVLQLLQNGSTDDWDLPEGAYVRPLPLADQHLRELVDVGLGRRAGAGQGRPQRSA